MLVLVFPWGESHYLGPLTTAEVASARFCRKIPDTVALLLLEDTCIPSYELPPFPAEMLLKEHVKLILENEEFCGSLPSSHVQNLVREFPFYNEGMSRFKSWSVFVTFFSKHYGSWSLLCQENDQCVCPMVNALVAPAFEIRLVANRFHEECARFDLNRNFQRLQALQNLCEYVEPLSKSSKGADRNLTKAELRKLSSNSNFLLLNSVNYINILKMFSQKLFKVLFSPLHPITINKGEKGSLEASQLIST
ncbi:hypothetical protein STCU_06160 [Strigomonas culicis]|uniref:Uncharacterized protein n=1 Tax=Strigomonas culicis TaxID=28005 RepID=S9V920_9TRYP|nr:hypothetical protein STCU_07698 [Strigomonas culicis]EPY24369.1 hypothetical protein STCU_07215 [Strigomonas culicis]EPY26627.1 hypothetical protein STCU_06160 [Strigomonas culicis]|eukprot:EPY23476.1 hypothetical protein STCU_07698 [Strigomonas culicis]